MSKIVAESWIPVPIERVFAFFSNPKNLPRIMPSQVAAKIEDLCLVPPSEPEVVESGGISADPPLRAGVGSEIAVSYRVIPFLPFRAMWVARIVEFVPGSQFRDIQVRGPMKYWSHTHQFIAENHGGAPGTLVRDVVEYELPLGVLGSFADALVVRALMRRTFQSRQRALAQLLY